MSQEMAPSFSQLAAPETEMLLRCDVEASVILVTFAPCHAGRGRGRGGAQFRAIITGQRLAEFNKTTISCRLGEFFLQRKYKTLESNSSVEFVVFTMAGC